MSHQGKTVWLLCVNDFHAELEESEGFPGSAKLVTEIRRFCREHDNTVVLFGGDNYKGNPISEHLEGKPVSEMMRLLNVEVSVVGNHEFDFGMERLQKWQQEGQYRFLAANLVECESGRIPHVVKPYHILEVEGVRIMIVGLALPERLDTVDRPQEMKNYRILHRQESIDAVRKLQQEKGEGIAATIALTHYGLRYQDGTKLPNGDEAVELCESLELDGMFAAHLHQFMALDIHGVAVAEGGGNSRGFAWLRLDFDDEGSLQKVTPGYEDIRQRQESIVPDSEMSAIWNDCKESAMEVLGKRIALLEKPVFHRDSATFEVNPEGTPLSSMATKLLRSATGSSIALFYSGRIGEGFSAGELTLYKAYQTLFFSNGIVTMQLSGKVIRDNVEWGIRTLAGDGASPIAVGGLKVEADFSRPHGKRILQITLEDGTPLEEDRRYTVAMDDFLADNSLGFDFTSAKDIQYTGISLRECMIEQIAQDGVIEQQYTKAIVNLSDSNT